MTKVKSAINFLQSCAELGISQFTSGPSCFSRVILHKCRLNEACYYSTHFPLACTKDSLDSNERVSKNTQISFATELKKLLFMKPPQAFGQEYITFSGIKSKGLLNYSLCVLCEHSSTAKTT